MHTALPIFVGLILQGPPLAPCRVELEHTFVEYGLSDRETWHTLRWEVDPIAPVPITTERAIAMVLALGKDGVDHFVVLRGRLAVVFVLSDSSILYELDDRGRTAMIDWDPAADRGVYHFRYAYECE